MAKQLEERGPFPEEQIPTTLSPFQCEHTIQHSAEPCVRAQNETFCAFLGH